MSVEIQFSADATERSNRLTGNVIIIAYKGASVVHVSTVKNDLGTLQREIELIKDEHGLVMFKDDKYTSTLSMYEIIHASIESELDHQLFQEQALEALAEKEEKEATAKFILDMLSTKSFDVFYKGIHEAHITGDEGAMDYDEIHKYVVDKFA